MVPNFLFRTALAVFLALSLLSCQKDLAVMTANPIPGRSSTQSIEAHYGGFDWDNPNVTTMPVSVRLNSPAVSVPWRSTGGLPLDPAIVDDYHKVDGWELMYNSFSPDDFPRQGVNGVVATSTNLPTGGLYFALYNRFRGILRFYLYVPPGTYNYSTQLAHGLQAYTNTYAPRALDFEGFEIVDAAYSKTNGMGFTKINKDGLPITGGWYAMQYEIAYDSNFPGTTYPNPGFKWDVYSESITKIKVNGTEIGTSRGVITTAQSDFDWTSFIVNGGLAFVEIFATGGISTAAGAAANPFAVAAQSGLAGNTTSLLSGIFGTTNGGQQTVDLKMNADIALDGNLFSSQIYSSNSIPFSGQTVASSNEVQPIQNHQIGIFNLTGRPQVSETIDYYTKKTTFQITSDMQQLMKINPDLNRSGYGASITNIKYEVVVLDTQYYTAVTGQNETIGSRKVITNPNSVVVQFPGRQSPPTAIAVRVSFNVVPYSSSSPSQFIVKSFYADVN